MHKALYFPHTNIENPDILKSALLLWDSVDTIVPRRDWISYRTGRNKLISEAMELVVTHHVPTEEERGKAHEILEESMRNGFVRSLVEQSPPRWGNQDYFVYPEKFLDRTWRILERDGMAHWADAESDYQVPAVVGFYMMSILADACAGTQIQKITDRAEAYEWIGQRHAQILGSQYIKGLDASQVAPAHDRLVSLSVEVLNGRDIPLKKLIALRKRELRSPRSGYSAMRRRYLATLQQHLEKIGREARSATDVRELDREFKENVKEDLIELKNELRLASIKPLLSKEVLISTLILAGCLVAPIPGLTALAASVGGVGIIPLLRAAVEHRAARREALQKHKMSWLFLAQQGPLHVR